jgi:hypothetical protein
VSKKEENFYIYLNIFIIIMKARTTVAGVAACDGSQLLIISSRT